jgi:hypothetical protein
MNESEKAAARESGFTLAGSLVVESLERPLATQADTRQYQLRFRKEGYSDFAILHLTDDGKALSLKIEPFLSRVEISNTYVNFAPCL